MFFIPPAPGRHFEARGSTAPVAARRQCRRGRKTSPSSEFAAQNEKRQMVCAAKFAGDMALVSMRQEVTEFKNLRKSLKFPGATAERFRTAPCKSRDDNELRFAQE
jgi:hypothetical protein